MLKIWTLVRIIDRTNASAAISNMELVSKTFHMDIMLYFLLQVNTNTSKTETCKDFLPKLKTQIQSTGETPWFDMKNSYIP